MDPTVIQADQKIWKRTTSKLGLTPEKVIKENGKDVLKIVTQLIQNNTDVGREVIKTVTQSCPKLILDHIVDEVKANLTKPELLQVTVDEFMIYQTPEGELFDKAAVENMKSEGQGQNMKRENKAYSYKEQMEELALRK